LQYGWKNRKEADEAMLMIIALACVLIWFPILCHHFDRRGLLILIIWLFFAPIISNLISRPGANPFFQSPTTQGMDSGKAVKGAYLTLPTTIRLNELLEPNRALFVVFSGVLLGNAVLKRRYLLPLDRTEMYMGVFAILLLISVFWQSRRIAFGLRTASDAFIVPFLAYYLARRLVRNGHHFRNLTQLAGYMGVCLITICLVERLSQGSLFYRLSGPFPSPNTLHTVMVVIFFMVVLDSLHSASSPGEDQALPRPVRGFVLCLAPLVILLTLTRGNWAGFLLGVWVFLFLGRRLVSFSRKVGVIGFALMSALIVVIAVPILIPEELVERRIGNVPHIYGRFVTWSAVLQQGIADPIFGIGLNNLRNVLAETNLRVGDFQSYSTVHNSFLAIFSELGAIGLLTYLAISISIVQSALNMYRTGTDVQDRWRGVALVAGTAAYLAPAMFANTLYSLVPLHHLYVYVFAGAVAGIDSRRRSVPSAQVSLEKPAWMSKGVMPRWGVRRHEEGA
jgi:O-antigen ligase